MSDSWSEWIMHNGGGCPLSIGDVFQAVLILENWTNPIMPLPSVLTTFSKTSSIWMGDSSADYSVLKYRLLKPTPEGLIRWNKKSAEHVEDLKRFCESFEIA